MSEFEIAPQSLPSSWALTTLGKVVEYGKTDKAESSEIPGDAWVLELEDIEKGSSRILSRFLQSERESRSTKNRFIAGDVLYGKLRPYLNKVVIADKLGFCTTEIVPLRAGAALDNRYLFHWLKHPAFLKYVEAASHGMSMPRLGTEAGRSAPLVVAPRQEQTRIADQLDTLLARIQVCNDRLDAIPVLLKRFRRAVVAAATSGSLTEEWRATNSSSHAESELLASLAQRAQHEKKPPSAPDLRHWREPTLPENWVVASVHQFAECLDRLRVPIKKDAREAKEGLYPYYGANGEVGRIDKYIFDDELVLVTEDETFYGRVKPIAYRSSGKCWVNNHAHVLRAPTKAANDYLCFSLMYYNVLPWLTGTSGRAKLTQQALNSLPIALPPAAEIVEIVRRVKVLFELSERIETIHLAAVKQAQRIPALTLAKAFRGELVQQDPQDEPASALLQRIANTPTKAAVTTPRGRPRNKQSNPFTVLPKVQQDPAVLPAGSWAAGVNPDEHATTAQLIAVLKAWGEPMPQDHARLAAVLCLQPRLFTAILPAQDVAPWRRLVGAEAETLPASVAALQPAVNTHWRRALAGMRARGDLVVSRASPQDIWALGPGADRVDTAGWPDGRAGWVAAYLRAHGVEALLPLLSPAAVDFVHARAA